LKDVVLPGVGDTTKLVKKKMVEKLDKRKQVDTFIPGSKVMVLDQTKSSKWDQHYEGPYEIVRQNRGGAYTLKDSLGDIIPSRRTAEMLVPIAEDGSWEESAMDDHYEVEKVVDHKLLEDGAGYEYLVKWKGYASDANQWVKAVDFGSLVPITKYWKYLKKTAKEAKKAKK
jgi:hypothetical protein